MIFWYINCSLSFPNLKNSGNPKSVIVDHLKAKIL